MTLRALPNPVSVPFSHAAIYNAIPQKRPEIEVEIATTGPSGMLQGRPVRTTLLVDSGADTTVLDNSYAAALSIDLNKCKVIKVQGVTGSDAMRETTVRMNLCGSWYTVPVWFSAGQQPGLLGRNGVFDNILVAFLHGRGVLLAATT